MNRVMAGVVALATALALAGCARQAGEIPVESPVIDDPYTLGDALGGTGGLLMIPFFGLLIAAIVGHVVWYDQASNNERSPKWVIYSYIISGLILMLSVLLWVTAIWSGIGK